MATRPSIIDYISLQGKEVGAVEITFDSTEEFNEKVNELYDNGYTCVAHYDEDESELTGCYQDFCTGNYEGKPHIIHNNDMWVQYETSLFIKRKPIGKAYYSKANGAFFFPVPTDLEWLRIVGPKFSHYDQFDLVIAYETKEIAEKAYQILAEEGFTILPYRQYPLDPEGVVYPCYTLGGH